MERNGKVQKEPTEVLGLNRITKKRLLELCKKDKLYQTPELNDVLYLHFQGFQNIECLEEYTGLKCLWLESNAISEIGGLYNQTKLKCLFLQSNLIKRIENLENCVQLDTLNLASNFIRKIENCGSDILPCLNTLNLSSNSLRDHEGLKELVNCKTLSVLDLSNNRIDDILVVKVFEKMPQLRVLVLQGNPVVSKIPQYRKTLILACKELTYLDSRPVFPKDRACAEAWKRGGYEGERKEHERWNRQDRRKIRESVNDTIRMRNKHRSTDKQLDLIPSSDSEDEIEAEKKRKQKAEIDAGINLEMGLWDEVDDTKSSSSSSEMNVSSSTSAIDTTDSNGSVSYAESKSHNAIQVLNNSIVEEKIMNDKSGRNTKLLDLNENIGVANMLNIVEGSTIAEASGEKLEMKELPKKATLIEDITAYKGNVAMDTNTSKSEVDDEIETGDDNGKTIMNDLSCDELRSHDDEINSSSEFATGEDNGKTIMNDLSCAESREKRVQLQIETVDMSVPDYEPEIMLIDDSEEELQQRLRQESADAPPEVEDEIPKSIEQLEYEKECKESNDKVVKDFEELASRMDDFIAELQNLNERTDIHLYDSSLNDRDSSCDTVDEERELSASVNGGSIVKDRMKLAVEHLKEVTVLEAEILKEVSKAAENENQTRMQVNQSSQKNELQLNSVNTVERYESETSTKEKSRMSESKSEKELDTTIGEGKIEEYHIGDFLPVAQIKPAGQNEDTPAQEIYNDKGSGDHGKNPEDYSTPKYESDPQSTPTFTRRNERTFEVFEKEAAELKKLLQKLEEENEQLYNINYTRRDLRKESIEMESITTEVLCEDIVDELVEDLSIEAATQKLRYSQFDFETDEEDNLREAPKSGEPIKPISEVLTAFNEFFEGIASKNRETIKREEQARGKVESTVEQKAASLKYLLSNSGALDQFNESAEEINEKYEAVKERRVQKIRAMVERVYAQRDKYDDTLDVVDGKLVVVKKDTGEIEDMPPVLREEDCSDGEDEDSHEDEEGDEVSDEEDDKYETAQSDDEFVEIFPGEHHLDSRRPSQLNICLQSAQLIQASLERHRLEQEEENNENDVGNDNFYSLGSANTGSKLFENIDEEFFSTINFESFQFNDIEEQQLAECARSYEELKQHMSTKLKEKRSLTEEANDSLEKTMFNVEAQNNDEKENKADEPRPIQNYVGEMEMKVQNAIRMAKVDELLRDLESLKNEEQQEKNGRLSQLDGNVNEGWKLYEDLDISFHNVETILEMEPANNERELQQTASHKRVEWEPEVHYEPKRLSMGIVNLYEYSLKAEDNEKESQSNAAIFNKDPDSYTMKKTGTDTNDMGVRVWPAGLNESYAKEHDISGNALEDHSIFYDIKSTTNLLDDSDCFYDIRSSTCDAEDDTIDIEELERDDKGIFTNPIDTYIEEDNESSIEFKANIGPEGTKESAEVNAEDEIPNGMYCPHKLNKNEERFDDVNLSLVELLPQKDEKMSKTTEISNLANSNTDQRLVYSRVDGIKGIVKEDVKKTQDFRADGILEVDLKDEGMFNMAEISGSASARAEEILEVDLKDERVSNMTEISSSASARAEGILDVDLKSAYIEENKKPPKIFIKDPPPSSMECLTLEDEIQEQINEISTAFNSLSAHEQYIVQDAFEEYDSINPAEVLANPSQLEFSLEVFDENDAVINEITLNAEVTYPFE